MGNSSVDSLVPKEKPVTLCGVSYIVKPYKLKDLVFFSREITDALGEIKRKNPTMEFKESNAMNLLPLFLEEAERLVGLMGRAVNKDKAWMEENLEMVDFSELFLAITEVNNFGKMISNFIMGWSHLKKQKVLTSAVA